MNRFFETDEKHDAYIIKFTSCQITLSNSNDLKLELENFNRTHTAHNYILDFSNVEFVTSLLIAILVFFLKRVKDSGRTVKLCCISKEALGAFQVAHMEHVFEIYPTVESAL